VTGYIKLWLREVLQVIGGRHKTKLLVNELQFLRKPGVYVRYRDGQCLPAGIVKKLRADRVPM